MPNKTVWLKYKILLNGSGTFQVLWNLDNTKIKIVTALLSPTPPKHFLYISFFFWISMIKVSRFYVTQPLLTSTFVVSRSVTPVDMKRLGPKKTTFWLELFQKYKISTLWCQESFWGTFWFCFISSIFFSYTQAAPTIFRYETTENVLHTTFFPPLTSRLKAKLLE